MTKYEPNTAGEQRSIEGLIHRWSGSSGRGDLCVTGSDMSAILSDLASCERALAEAQETVAAFEHDAAQFKLAACEHGVVDRANCVACSGLRSDLAAAQRERDAAVAAVAERERQLDPESIAHWDAMREQRDAAVKSLDAERQHWLDWADERWRGEVMHRPVENVHRRTLDATWKQVARHAEERAALPTQPPQGGTV